MKNTKLIKFTHKFSKYEKLKFIQNTAEQGGANSNCPDTVISMVMLARYCDDDSHLFYENLEVSGTGIFKFQDM